MASVLPLLGRIIQFCCSREVVGLLWSGLRSLEWGWFEEMMLGPEDFRKGSEKHALPEEDCCWFCGGDYFSRGQVSIQTCFRFYSWPLNGVLSSDTVLCSGRLLWITCIKTCYHTTFSASQAFVWGSWGYGWYWFISRKHLLLIRHHSVRLLSRSSVISKPDQDLFRHKMATFWRQ